MPPADRITPVSILDLTVDQVAAIEADVGLPVTRWNDAPRAKLLTGILAASTGRPASEFGAMTLRELLSRVDMSGQDDGGPGPEV